jgi:hypothetical protein
MPENVMTIPTVQALYPAIPNAIDYIPDQVTDGKLLLSVESVEDTCHRLHEPIAVNLTFRNLAAEPIVLYDTFELAINRSFRGGNLSLLINDSSNNPVFTLYDYSMADYWLGYLSPTRRELPVNDEHQVEIEFVIPTDRVLSISSDGMEETTPITAGDYFVRFLYSGIGPKEELWTGRIASNQISMCLE